MRGLSLLWKILLSTSIAVTVLLAATGWIVLEQFERIAAETLGEEVKAGFQAYEALWQAQASQMGSASLILSRMPDVRAAFGTGDQATIRDTAGEIWAKIGGEDRFFLVTDPKGVVLASLSGPAGLRREVAVVRQAARRFPEQTSGFWVDGPELYQVVVTPVYVAAGQGRALINVLVVGRAVNGALARQMKQATGGSDFVFECRGRVAATTLAFTAPLQPTRGAVGMQVEVAGDEFFDHRTALVDLEGQTVGALHILRPYEALRDRMARLRRNLAGFWLLAMAAALGFSFWTARRVLEPVRALDRAAAEIGRGNLEPELRVNGDDELGRLARTFRAMCESMRSARAELIRQERISTIGRLSTSLIHDLRNPLAAIYGGSEMLVDEELEAGQVKRLAANIYRASRRVQALLGELAEVTRGRTKGAEPCRLAEVVEAAREGLSGAWAVEVDGTVELMLERGRMERVFENLFANALEAGAGRIEVTTKVTPESVVVTVSDDGRGIPAEVRERLFEPFATAGKKNGIGLGLALARQTLIEHGGELWLDGGEGGARFKLRLPR